MDTHTYEKVRELWETIHRTLTRVMPPADSASLRLEQEQQQAAVG